MTSYALGRAHGAAHACRRCLYRTDHPLGLTLDEEGICSGCRVHEEKDRLDWDARWALLEALVKPYRSRDARNYDCIVPVSGANDSYFIVHVVKERLGLNPLLVTYNKYFNTPLGIRNLANLRIRFDCDILVQNVNPVSVRRITRTALREIGSMYWPCLAGQTVFPVQTAVRFGIPLIVWGAHQGLEQVGMFSHEHEVEMTRRYRYDHDLMAREPADLIGLFDTLAEEDVWQYRYPDDAELASVGVRGIYLGNYVRWDPKAQHEQMMRTHGYETAAFARTFDCYDHVDCYNYMNVHDLLKLYKHGYSKVTDHAAREIRHGRLGREEGLALVRRHEQAAVEHLDLFCDWLGVEPNALGFVMDQHRDPRFWSEDEPGRWRFHGWSTMEQPQAAANPAPRRSDPEFSANSRLERDRAHGYIVVGRGYP
ncbi:N-acetyl sugar amidotransferase [Salinarimonas rosea]|uniref:N-acetyl sugar amidotransferase n=1 Tax=Salinarimonas rosea TaxID=552063 RepID=UPI00041E3B68|nr:N-acetyl sugar amidotransferase [Salinarimonas rosea]